MASVIINSTNATSDFDGVNQGILYYFTTKAYTFETVDEVPEYVNKASPFFTGFIILECLISLIKGLPTFRLNDGINSISAGVLSQLFKLVIMDIEIVVYIWVYENFRLTTLPWDSPWTWWLCFLAVDFGYYFFHRAAHEVNIFWAAHQAHHSSEDYNLTTALRQGVGQNLTSHLFYLPIALAIPPAVCYIHFQFNLLYQFWIHTELIRSLGPLEYIFNTPSHHRVHHGRNPYCIDKNYGGTLIIWDRIFGTFQAETDEKIAYGLTHPLNSWNPLWAQICHCSHIFKTFCTTQGLSNKISVLIKGPGWSPGKPRLCEIADIPKIEQPIRKYDSCLPAWGNIYTFIHFLLSSIIYMELFARHLSLSQLHVLLVALYFILTLTVFGALFDNKPYGPILEFLRCSLCVVVDVITSNYGVKIEVLPSFLPMSFVRCFYLSSAYIWFVVTLIDARKEAKKVD